MAATTALEMMGPIPGRLLSKMPTSGFGSQHLLGDGETGRRGGPDASLDAGAHRQGEPHEAHPAYWAPFVVAGGVRWHITDSSATCHGISLGAPFCPRLLRYQTVEFG